jgi:hypothetical protein
LKLKEIASLVCAASKRKEWNVKSSMHKDAWIRKVTLDKKFTMTHASQFVDLWRQGRSQVPGYPGLGPGREEIFQA